MKHTEIIALAKEEGLSFIPEANSPLARIVRKAVEREREACATLIQLGPQPVTGFGSKVEIGFGARTAYAAAIRARGQKEGA